MDNELVVKRNWWNCNWKWLVPLSGFMLIILTIIISSINDLSDFAQTYADPSIYQNAINQANKNENVIQSLGELQPIDNLAILEGNSSYSNDNKTASISVRVNGTNGKAKMDIVANKIENKWEYQKIRIRIKKSNKEIEVIN